MRIKISTLILLCCAPGIACAPKISRNDPTVWKEIKLNFKQIDNEGLTGPPNGKVSVHYEFCIPQSEKLWKRVHQIDTTAQLMRQSKGRIACSSSQWLIIGNTHQPTYRLVLYDLAALPYVQRIDQVYWE